MLAFLAWKGYNTNDIWHSPTRGKFEQIKEIQMFNNKLYTIAKFIKYIILVKNPNTQPKNFFFNPEQSPLDSGGLQAVLWHID